MLNKIIIINYELSARMRCCVKDKRKYEFSFECMDTYGYEITMPQSDDITVTDPDYIVLIACECDFHVLPNPNSACERAVMLCSS